MLGALPLLSLFLATTGLAAPPHKEHHDVPASALRLPSNQTQLVSPTTAPNYVVIGVGNQNYSCTDSGNYTSDGAVAQLFDITSLYGTPEFSRIQDDAYDIWSDCPTSDPLEHGLAVRLNRKFGIDVVGQHYFVNSSTGSLSPKFDFTSSGPTAGNPDAFVVAVRAGDIPAPTCSQDIDWLELNGVDGKLASEVFRVDTNAGKPPSSCTPGSPVITVKYTAQYWFFGSTLST
ncbi:hypothetical protein BJY52DRAFT_1182167 [Lactarius psammicola]|nr:hypothetical protein BJY52DRAFT_1182167 [Lactarius psammicola]